MSLLKFFKKKEHGVKVKTQQATATFYPDQILIVTDDKTVVGYSIVTTTMTKLPIDAAADTIGQTVRKHLSSSRTDVPAPSDFKARYQAFLNSAGFKNAKAHHKGGRHLFIYQKDQAVIITPTINGGATGKKRGFLGSKHIPSIQVSASIGDEELGERIKEGWLKCIDDSD